MVIGFINVISVTVFFCDSCRDRGFYQNTECPHCGAHIVEAITQIDNPEKEDNDNDNDYTEKYSNYETTTPQKSTVSKQKTPNFLEIIGPLISALIAIVIAKTGINQYIDHHSGGSVFSSLENGLAKIFFSVIGIGCGLLFWRIFRLITEGK